MNTNHGSLSRVGACVVMMAAAGSASGQWSFGSFDDPEHPDRAKMSKRVELTNPGAEGMTNFRWEFMERLDTLARGANVLRDPKEWTEDFGGDWTTGGPLDHIEEAMINGSSALVSSCFEVRGSVSTGSVVGTLGVAGRGVLGAARAEAVGSAENQLRMQWTKVSAAGKIRHAGDWVTAADAGSFSSKTRMQSYKDPIDLRIFDRTRDAVLIDARIWETNCWVTDGLAIMDRGTFSTSGLGSGAVFITAGHELLGGVGHIALTWESGRITSSFDSGIFDGLLPVLGTSSLGPLFHIGDADGNFEYDIDLGAATAAGYDWTVDMASSGEGSAELVPAPGATVLGLLALGLGAVGRRRR